MRERKRKRGGKRVKKENERQIELIHISFGL